MRIKNKIIPKFIAVFIAVSLIAIGIPITPSYATTDQIVSGSSATGSPGDTVQIDFTMNDGVGIAGMQFNINYDKNIFEVDTNDANFDGLEDSVIPAPATELNMGSPPIAVGFHDGYITIVALRSGGVAIPPAAAGQMVNIVGMKFTIKDGAYNGTYPINITDLKASSEPLGTPIPGYITVTGGIDADDISLTAVKVNGVEATPSDETTYDVELPAGTDLEALTSSDIEIVLNDSEAEYDDPVTADGGATWTFDVTSRNGNTVGTYTINITLKPLDKTPLTNAMANANAAKEGVEVSADGTDVPTGDDWVTQAALDALNDAIDAAELALENAVTQDYINDAADALNDAIELFNASVKSGTQAKQITLNNITGLKPVRGEAPKTSINTIQYTGTVIWEPAVAAGKKFDASTVYYAQITITPKTGWTLDGLAYDFFTVADFAEMVYQSDNPGSFEAAFPKTGAASTGGGGGGGGVVAPTATGIEIKSAPDKVVYTEGDELALTGLEVIVTYSDGTKKTIGVKDFADNDITVSPKAGDILETGDSEIVIKVNGKTVNQAITVNKKDIVIPPVTEPEQVLTDISGHWAKDSIEYLVGIGALAGYPDGTFRPDAPITRAEFAKVIVEAFELKGTGKVFEDTAQHWARNYIAIAAANGIVLGYNEEEFGPDDLITREQMAIIIVKAAGLTGKSGVLDFIDEADISAWAYDWVVSAAENELMSGYTDNSFKPLNNATRAEAVTVIYNVLMK